MSPGGGDRGPGGLSSHAAETPGQEHPSLPRHAQEVRNNRLALCLHADLWYCDNILHYLSNGNWVNTVFDTWSRCHISSSIVSFSQVVGFSVFRALLPPTEYARRAPSYRSSSPAGLPCSSSGWVLWQRSKMSVTNFGFCVVRDGVISSLSSK